MPNASILIVDDEEIMRRLLELHLANAGYDVWTAEDPVAAAHIIVKRKPDLLILDVEMPYMNGYEFLAALKADPQTQSIPVVFLTTRDDVADQAPKLGAAAYLTKPVMATRLLEVVAIFAAA
jgi:CheY-like chemotaxis protein